MIRSSVEGCVSVSAEADGGEADGKCTFCFIDYAAHQRLLATVWEGRCGGVSLAVSHVILCIQKYFAFGLSLA